MDVQLKTYHDPDLDIQRPFSVAVVMPTILRPHLATALRSIYQQDIKGTIQILVGIDLPLGEWSDIEPVLKERPKHIAITFLWLGYSTKIKEGGNWKPWGGGSLRTILSFLANSRYLAYLDDDNWYAPNHLSSLLDAIKDKDWAHSRRWFVKEDIDEPICEDIWESVGPDKGVFKSNFGGFVDTNCYLVDKIKTHIALPFWCVTEGGFLRNGFECGEDRSFFRVLKNKFPKIGSTDQATISYRIRGTDTNHDPRWKYIKSHKVETGLNACRNWCAPPPAQKERATKYHKNSGYLHVLGSSHQRSEIAVIIPSNLNNSLLQTIQSVYKQRFDQPVQILIGMNTNKDPRPWLDRLNQNRPNHISLMLFHPGYRLKGHFARTILSFIAHAPYLAFLDEGNTWQSDHLSSLHRAIQGNNYAYSLRRFIHPDGLTPVCNDIWEAIGPQKGKQTGYIDPNCLLLHAQSGLNTHPIWSHRPTGNEETVSRFLISHAKGAGINKTTVNYKLKTNDPMHLLRTLYFGPHWVNANFAALRKRLIKP